MQVFVPLKDFKQIAKCLDYRRLGKERVEAKDIITLCMMSNSDEYRNSLFKYNKQAAYIWKRYNKHPIIEMWKYNVPALIEYYNTIVIEWKDRGYVNNLPHICLMDFNPEYPDWFGRDDIHNSHKSKLLLKGEFDALVANISKAKGKRYHQWQSAYKLPKRKNMLRFEHLDLMYKINDGQPYTNHYKQFKWDVPMNLNYVWK